MEPIVAAEFEVINKNVFTVQWLYTEIHDWLVEHEFVDTQLDDGDKFEIYYMEKIDPPPMKEVWAWWRAHHKPRGSSYYKYKLNINMHFLGLKEVEVMHDGQKLKSNHCEATLRVKGVLELDYDSQWDNNPFLKNFHEVLTTRIKKRDIEAHKRELYKKTYELQAKIKEFLKLNQTNPVPSFIKQKKRGFENPYQ